MASTWSGLGLGLANPDPDPDPNPNPNASPNPNANPNPNPNPKQDSRVALVGANGTGKSTLLKLMLEDLEPTKGEVRQSRMCKVGVYDQHSCDQLAKGVRLAKGAKLAP